jgi:DNA repair protein RadC
MGGNRLAASKVFYFRAFSHCVTPVKVSLAALDSTFPPSAFPLARSTTAPGSAAGVVTGRAAKGQRAGEPDNWIFHPARCSARAFGTMNQSTLNLGDHAPEHGFTMAEGERPQQRLENFGVTAVSDTELLAIILQGNGTSTDRVVNLASRLIAEAGSIAGLISWVSSDYQRLKGIGRIKGLQLAAIAEIARRMMTSPRVPALQLNRADLIAAHFAQIVAGLQVEKFWVLCLNRKNRLIKQVEVTSGTATAALAHPREVYREAIRQAASGIVCVHNHPSGDPAPSTADIHVTRQLREAARTVDIELLDHVIVGNASADPAGLGFYSFRSAGLL